MDRDVSGKRLISNEEMTRLRSILKDKQAELKAMKSKLEAIESGSHGTAVELQ